MANPTLETLRNEILDSIKGRKLGLDKDGYLQGVRGMKSLFNVIQRYRPAYVCRACDGGGCAKCSKRGYTCYAK